MLCTRHTTPQGTDLVTALTCEEDLLESVKRVNEGLGLGLGPMT